METHLLIIDPQNDFCNEGGALYVQGASEDMERLAEYIKDEIENIDVITVTLDTHDIHDIAHPAMWENQEGENPEPFTIISYDDVCNQEWKLINSGMDNEEALDYAKKYTNSLAVLGKYPLCIWPPHCLEGSFGHEVYEPLAEALSEWERVRDKKVNYVIKGTNPLTEHYSAFSAEIPLDNDPKTKENLELYNSLINSDTILVAGEAGSHCVASTIEDLVEYGKEEISSRLEILENTMSPVTGFEKAQEAFFQRMRDISVRFTRV